MTAMKKIGAVLATIIIAIVKIPATCISFVIGGIEMILVTWMMKLSKVIDCDWWREAMYDAAGDNSRGLFQLSDYFDDLQEDLA